MTGECQLPFYFGASQPLLASLIHPWAFGKPPNVPTCNLSHHQQRQCQIALAVTYPWTPKPSPVDTAKPLSKLSDIPVSPFIDRNPKNFYVPPVHTTKTTPATIPSVPSPKSVPFITTRPNQSYPRRPLTSAVAGKERPKIGVSGIKFG